MAKSKTISPWTKAVFSLKNLLPRRDGSERLSRAAIEEKSQNILLLDSCRSMKNSLAEFCYDREINRNYYFNRQFCERIPDPDNPGHEITEETYLKRQGMIPLSINLIRVNSKAIEGLFTKDKMDPLVKSRIREEQGIGEALTLVMQHIYQSHNIYGLCARGYEEFLISALPIFRVGWGWDMQRKENDVFVERCDVNRMFWDSNVGTSEQYFANVSVIGYLHDMTKADVISNFATSAKMAEEIEQAYIECNEKYPPTTQQQIGRGEPVGINFDSPREFYMCRVIEVWTREAHAVYACHDTLDGITYTVPATQLSLSEIEAINEKRKADMAAAGGDPEQSPIIKYEFRVDQDWVVRYLTPTGYTLRKEVGGLLHGSHPFVLGGFPLVDGITCSAVNDQRNAQRLINRTLIRSEFMEMNRAKGFKWVNKNILDRSELTIDQFREKYTSASGMVALDIREGEERIVMGPTETQNGYNAQVDMNKIQFFADILDKVSGTPGAVRGEKPTAGTPSSLYAQQNDNANNNIADPLEWYNGLIQQLDYKILMTILQNYDEQRYLRIVGDDYRKDIEYILNSDQRDILCDVALIKSPSYGIARAARENMLEALRQDGTITGEEYLETTSNDGADKVLEKVKARKEAEAQAQAQAQQAAAMQGAIPAQPGAAAPAAPAQPQQPIV